MAGITLNRFDIAAVQFQLISDAGMTKTVKDDLWQIILLNQFCKEGSDARLFRRHAQAICHDQIEICIFIAKGFFREILLPFPLYQHLSDSLRKEDLAGTGCRLWFLQYKDGFIAFPQFRKDAKHVLLAQSLHNTLIDTLQFFIHINIGFSGGNAFRRDVYAIPGQAKQFPNSKGTGKCQVDGQLQALILTYVVYSYEDEKGEKKQKWEGFTTRADAVRRKSEVEYRKEVGSVVIPQCETMNELLKEYIAMYGKSNWSLSTYSANVNMIKSYIQP